MRKFSSFTLLPAQLFVVSRLYIRIVPDEDGGRGRDELRPRDHPVFRNRIGGTTCLRIGVWRLASGEHILGLERWNQPAGARIGEFDVFFKILRARDRDAESCRQDMESTSITTLKSTARATVSESEECDVVEIDDNASSRSGRRKRSKVLDQFIELDTDEHQCTLCLAQNPDHKVIIRRNKDRSTNVFWRHVEKAHRKIHDQLKGIPKNQKRLFEYDFLSAKLYLCGISKERTKEEFLRFICDNDLPWQLVKKKSFRRLWYYGTQSVGDVPGPDAVKATASAMYTEVRIKLIEMFAGIHSVSLIVEAWTSGNNLSLLGITAHWIDGDWKLCDLLLAIRRIKRSHCGTNLANLIVEVAYEYGIESKLCAITTDNVSNNRTMMASIVAQLRTVNPDFTMDRHVPCVSHVLNLVVQAGLRIIHNPKAPEVGPLRVRDLRPYAALRTNELIDSQGDDCSSPTYAPLGVAVSRVRAIANAIQGSTQRMEKYVDMCKMFELPYANKIKVDCPTRWNSTFKMLERALAKKDVLDHMAVRFLATPCSDYVCSAKRLPITDVTSLISDLRAQLEHAMTYAGSTLDDGRREALRAACTAMYNKLMQYVDVIWANKTMATAGTLNPFSKIEVVQPSFREGVLSFIVGLLDSAGTTSTTGCDSEQDEGAGRHRLGQFASTKRQYTRPGKSRRPRATPRQELEKYLNIPCSEEEDSPLCWWKDVGTRYFPNLTKIASQFLAVSPTSAPVERLFSIGRGITMYRRGRLDADSIEMLMMLRAWFRCAEQSLSDSEDDLDDWDSSSDG
ncbi:putative transcriptional regulator tpeD [Wolffia australiana]